MAENRRPIRAFDLLREYDSVGIRDGQCWGPWRLEAKTFELVFDGHGKYRINLEEITD
jgi:hypothetical protein